MAEEAKIELNGPKSFRIGEVQSDGTMPDAASMTSFNKIKEGTFTLAITPPEDTPVNTEDSNLAYANVQGSTDKTITLELFGVKLSELKDFLGGTYTEGVSVGDDNIWEAPENDATILFAAEFDTKDSNGIQSTYFFKKLQVSAGWENTATKTDFNGINITFTILSAGDGNSPWGIKSEKTA